MYSIYTTIRVKYRTATVQLQLGPAFPCFHEPKRHISVRSLAKDNGLQEGAIHTHAAYACTKASPPWIHKESRASLMDKRCSSPPSLPRLFRYSGTANTLTATENALTLTSALETWGKDTHVT